MTSDELAAVVSAYRPQWVGFLINAGHAREDAEDMVQNALVYMTAHCERLWSDPVSVRRYAFRIVRHQRIQAQPIRIRKDGRVWAKRDALAHQVPLPRCASLRREPSEVCHLAWEAGIDVRRLILGAPLTTRERTCIILRGLGQWQLEEIAQHIGSDYRQVGTFVKRAVMKLRRTALGRRVEVRQLSRVVRPLSRRRVTGVAA